MKLQTLYALFCKQLRSFCLVFIALLPVIATDAQRVALVDDDDISLRGKNIYVMYFHDILLPIDSQSFYNAKAKKNHIKSEEVDFAFLAKYDTAGYLKTWRNWADTNSYFSIKNYNYSLDHRSATIVFDYYNPPPNSYAHIKQLITVFLSAAGQVDSIHFWDSCRNGANTVSNSTLYYRYDTLHRLSRVVDYGASKDSVLYGFSYGSADHNWLLFDLKTNVRPPKYIIRRIWRAFHSDDDSESLSIERTGFGSFQKKYGIYKKRNCRVYYENDMSPDILGSDYYTITKKSKLWHHTYQCYFRYNKRLERFTYNRNHVFFGKWWYDRVSNHRRKLTFSLIDNSKFTLARRYKFTYY